MAETFLKSNGSKVQQYQDLLPQITALIQDEPDLIANMANVTAILKQQFDWLWVGFYVVKNGILVLGPFQGPIACTRIAKGRGVCGQAWLQEQVMLVDDVNQFPDHIACSSMSQSEIVLPLMWQNTCIAVLDVDSEALAHFDAVDQQYLQAIIELLLKYSAWV